MAEIVILYWRDIPAQVTAKAGRRSARVKLSERFETAIDRAAMRAKLSGSDAYLAEWRRGAAEPCDDNIDSAVATLAKDIEAAYDAARLDRLVKAGGREEA